MQALGNFLLLSALLLLGLVVIQVAAFLSTAVFHVDVDWLPKGFPTSFPIVALPGQNAVETGLSYFSATMGSLLWIFEIGIAVALLFTGRRILAGERKFQLEEKEAIDRAASSDRTADPID